MYLPTSARVPALSTNKVASVLPLDRVATSLVQSELGIAAAIGPPRVEVAIVGTLGARGSCTLGKEGRVSIIDLFGQEVKRGGQHRSSCHQGAEEGFERDHVDENQA